jgi:hypothetical protein
MRYPLIGLTIAVCWLPAAPGQTPAAQNVDRVFYLTQNETAQDLQEIATTIRSVTDIRQVMADETQRTVTVTTTAGQMAMAEWLIHELDVPGPASQPRQYVAPGGGNDIVRIYFTHTAGPRDLQEIVTTIRATADIQRMFVYNSLRAAVLRASTAEMGLADWLMQKLDRPGQTSAPPEYAYAGMRGPEVARVFYLTHPQNRQDMQEIVTTLRSIADLQRIFTYNAPKAVAVRGPADRVALAQWLVSELDRAPDETPAAGAHQYTLPAGSDNQVRVFYLSQVATPDQRQKIATEVRTTANVPRLFVYNLLGALTLRGTVGQVATAERLLGELNQPH